MPKKMSFPSIKQVAVPRCDASGVFTREIGDRSNLDNILDGREAVSRLMSVQKNEVNENDQLLPVIIR